MRCKHQGRKNPTQKGSYDPRQQKWKGGKKRSTKFESAVFENKGDTKNFECSGAEFQFCSMKGASFVRTTVRDSCFFASDLSAVTCTDAAFVECDFRAAAFDDPKAIMGCKFNSCKLQGASFRQVPFQPTPPDFNGPLPGHPFFSFSTTY